jgi:hypothetical protein
MNMLGLAVITTVITVAITAYFLPTLIAWLRHVPDLATVLVINLLLGWTAAGWVVALDLAVRRAAPSIQVIGQVNGQLPITRRKTREPGRADRSATTVTAG